MCLYLPHSEAPVKFHALSHLTHFHPLSPPIYLRHVF